MGIFSKLKQTFSSKKDGDRYLSGLDKSKSRFQNAFGSWHLALPASTRSFWRI